MNGSSSTPGTPSQTLRFSLLVLACLGGWTLWALVLLPLLLPVSPPWESTLGVVARTTFWVVPCAIYLRVSYGQRWLKGMGLTVPRSPEEVLVVTLATLLVAALLVVSTAIQQGASALSLLESLVQHAKLRLRAPVFEELVFRGVLLAELLRFAGRSAQGAVGLRARYWMAQALGALIFTAVHWPWWLSARGFEATLASSPSLFVTGLVFGVVFAQTRSIWPCIALHWLNNELSRLSPALG